MNKKLNLVEKAVEIFGLSVEIEKLNSTLCEMLYGEKRDNEVLLKKQDELFQKRYQLKKLEEEFETIEKEITA